MARHVEFEGVAQFAMTRRSRSTVYWAAVSFALCHGVAVASYTELNDVNADLQWQLIHFAAVLCRFLLPFGLIVGGLVAHMRAKRTSNSDR